MTPCLIAGNIYVAPTVVVVLSAPHVVLANLIFPTAQRGRHYYRVHFIDEETKAQTGYVMGSRPHS